VNLIWRFASVVSWSLILDAKSIGTLMSVLTFVRVIVFVKSADVGKQLCALASILTVLTELSTLAASITL
jgi:hypothetical protein